MTHPCLVTLDSKSAPRVLFAGDRLVEVPLPAGSRVLYPRPANVSLRRSVREWVQEACEHPAAGPALSWLLRAGMKLTVVVDAAALPLGAEADPRAQVLDVLMPWLAEKGVDDVEIVVAGGLDKRRTRTELRQLVGPRVFRACWPGRLYSHDPEAAGALKRIGVAANSEPIEMLTRVVESDLVILLQLSGGGYPGFNGPLLRQLGDYRGHLRAAHAGSLSEASPDEALAFSRVRTFALSLVLDGPRFAHKFGFLGLNEDELTPKQRGMLSLLQQSTARLPRPARQKLLDSIQATPSIEAIFAGEPGQVSSLAADCHRQLTRVAIQGQADVLVTGVPHTGPYNSGVSMNPLLMQGLALGYLSNLSYGAALVKPGGTLIVTHPCTDRFDPQHAPHNSFLHQELTRTHDREELARRCVEEFATNPALIQMFRNGDACHPVHPYLTWMWGEMARKHLGKVIIVGADNEYVPHILGFETAPNLPKALYQAREGANLPQEIVCLHSPTISVGDVSDLSHKTGLRPETT